MGPVEWRAPDRPSLAIAVAARLSELLQAALASRPRAALVVPGGTTPGPVFDLLSQADLAWSRVDITLSDERWLAPDQAGSNEHLLRERLLRNKAAAAHLVGLYRSVPAPSAARVAVEQALAGLSHPFAAVLLGMGDDGHFASLFPGRPETASGLDPKGKAQAIALDAPVNGHPRISLSLASLLNARHILVLFQGAEKHAVLEAAKAAGPASAMPIRALLRQTTTPVEIHWAS